MRERRCGRRGREGGRREGGREERGREEAKTTCKHARRSLAVLVGPQQPAVIYVRLCWAPLPPQCVARPLRFVSSLWLGRAGWGCDHTEPATAMKLDFLGLEDAGLVGIRRCHQETVSVCPSVGQDDSHRESGPGTGGSGIQGYPLLRISRPAWLRETIVS